MELNENESWVERNAAELSFGGALFFFGVGVLASSFGVGIGVVIGIIGMVASFVWLAIYFPSQARGIDFDLEDEND